MFLIPSDKLFKRKWVPSHAAVVSQDASLLHTHTLWELGLHDNGCFSSWISAWAGWCCVGLAFLISVSFLIMMIMLSNTFLENQKHLSWSPGSFHPYYSFSCSSFIWFIWFICSLLVSLVWFIGYLFFGFWTLPQKLQPGELEDSSLPNLVFFFWLFDNGNDLKLPFLGWIRSIPIPGLFIIFTTFSSGKRSTRSNPGSPPLPLPLPFSTLREEDFQKDFRKESRGSPSEIIIPTKNGHHNLYTSSHHHLPHITT